MTGIEWVLLGISVVEGILILLLMLVVGGLLNANKGSERGNLAAFETMDQNFTILNKRLYNVEQFLVASWDLEKAIQKKEAEELKSVEKSFKN